MNTRTMWAVTLVAASIGPWAAAQTVTGENDTSARAVTQAQDRTEIGVDRELPPQVNDLGEDPRVPTEQDIEDPMRAPPPEKVHGDDRMTGGHESDGSAQWVALDTDGDGRISAEESRADADFSASFETTDADGDGFVSGEEWRAHRGAKAGMHEDESSDYHQDHDDGWR